MANPGAPEDVPLKQPSAVSPEKPLASIHDTYVYKTLSNPVLAAAEFKHVLPQEVVAEIDWDNLEQDTNRFTDENLDNHYTDLLFKTTLRGQSIRLRLLLEHSSHSKPFELLQTLRYQVRQWERDTQQKNHIEGQRLTPIITILLHHSEAGWRGRTRFMDYFGLDEDLARVLRPYVVDFGIVLDDISKVNAEALMQRPVPAEVQVLLFALRYGRSGRRVLDELPKIAPIVGVLLHEPNGKLVLSLFFVYMRRVARVSEADMRTALEDLIESRLDPEMVALWTQYEAGKLEGKLEGEFKMARSMLRRLLTQRFGALSPAAVARLESAALSELDAMSLRVLTAASVNEVLGAS
jgi:hypothetical protein